MGSLVCFPQKWAWTYSETFYDAAPVVRIKIPHQFANPVKNKINDLFANSVMATSVVVRCVLLSSDQLLRVEKLPVSSSADLIWTAKKQYERMNAVRNSWINHKGQFTLHRLGLGIVQKSSISIPILWLRYRFLKQLSCRKYWHRICWNVATLLIFSTSFTSMRVGTLTHYSLLVSPVSGRNRRKLVFFLDASQPVMLHAYWLTDVGGINHFDIKI